MIQNDDLCARLQNFEGSDELGNGDFTICYKAANLIEQQAAEIERLRKALEEAVLYNGITVSGDHAAWLSTAISALNTRTALNSCTALGGRINECPT